MLSTIKILDLSLSESCSATSEVESTNDDESNVCDENRKFSGAKEDEKLKSLSDCTDNGEKRMSCDETIVDKRKKIPMKWNII